MNNKHGSRLILAAVLSVLAVTTATVQAVTIDFETDEPQGEGGVPLAEGFVIGPTAAGPQPYADDGITITLTNAGAGGPLLIFNSADPTGGDADIGSPNSLCTDADGPANPNPPFRPGIGIGGGPAGIGPNCQPLNNVLIISQNGNTAVPNDSNAGGVITFQFALDAAIGSIATLDDVEGEFRTFDVNDTLLSTTPFIGQEENELDFFAIGECVNRIEIELDGSGAIPQLNFTPTICTNLTLTKDDGQLVYTPGSDLTYTITVTNNGPRDIPAGAVITDNVPAGTTFVSTSGCAEDPTGSPSCTLGAMAVGASANVSFTINVPADFTGPLTNTATVVSPPGTTETDITDNTDSDTDADPNAPQDLVAVKTVSDQTGDGIAQLGETLTYTITITNNTAATINDIDILDLLDDPAIVIDLGQDLVVTGDLDTDPGTPDIGDLNGPAPPDFDLDLGAGDTAIITFTVTVADAVAAGDTSIDNTVTVVGEDGAGPDACSAAGASCTTTIPIDPAPIPDIFASKSVSDANGNGIAEAGEVLTYTISVTNTTGATITENDVLDLVNDPGIIVDPTQILIVTNATGQDPNVADIADLMGNSGVGGDPVFDVDVPANATATIQYTVIVASPITVGDLSIDNSIEVRGNDGAGEDVCASSPACATSIPTPNPELTLIKSITSGSPYDSVNDVINYSFQVTNTGNIDLAGPVIINDDLTTNEACPALSTIGNNDTVLDVGEIVTCTASLLITQTDLNNSSITNTATAVADSVTSNPDNATAFQQPVLEASKAVTDANGNGVAEPGETLTYTIQITNSGGLVADNVLVQDAVNDPNIVVDGTQILGISNASDFIPAIPTIAILQAGFTVDIAAGATASITYTVVVSNPIAVNTNNTNTGSVFKNELFNLGFSAIMRTYNFWLTV